MCLIDRVLECDEQSITCTTNSHRNPDNPLLENGRLPSIVLVEYASQAAAIHAAFNRQEFTQGKPAYIGSTKNIVLNNRFLHNINEMLTIIAGCVLSAQSGAIYEFEVKCARLVAKGQINLILPE